MAARLCGCQARLVPWGPVHCCACHRWFADERARGLHRNGGGCVDPATVTGAGSGIRQLARRKDGVWVHNPYRELVV